MEVWLVLLGGLWLWGVGAITLRTVPVIAVLTLGFPTLCGLGLAAAGAIALMRQPDHSKPDVYPLPASIGTQRVALRPYRDTGSMSVESADRLNPTAKPNGPPRVFLSMDWRLVQGPSTPLFAGVSRSPYFLMEHDEGDVPAVLEYTVTAWNQAFVRSSVLRVGPSWRRSKRSWAWGLGYEGGILVGLSVVAVFLFPVVVWTALRNRRVLTKRSDYSP